MLVVLAWSGDRSFTTTFFLLVGSHEVYQKCHTRTISRAVNQLHYLLPALLKRCQLILKHVRINFRFLQWFDSRFVLLNLVLKYYILLVGQVALESEVFKLYL